MPAIAPRSRRPGLRSLAAVFLLTTSVAAGGVVAWMNGAAIEDFRRGVLGEAARVRADALSLTFMRSLHDEWGQVLEIARAVEFGEDPALVRARLDQFVDDGSQVSWIGFARTDGRVAIASGGLLVDADVSSRPWFTRGLEGPFAGDLHEAKLLAELIESDEPLRFLDFAVPVRGQDGGIIGVVGAHVNSAWAESRLLETAAALEVEAALVNAEGEIVYATWPLEDSAGRGGLRAAALGASRISVERWPDGGSYMTATLPRIGYGDMPPFGWNLVARSDSGAFERLRAEAAGQIVLTAVAVATALLAAGALFATFFLSPIARLARSLDEVSRGSDAYPAEETSSREAAQLSEAAARLQMRVLGSGPAAGARRSAQSEAA